MKTTTFAQNLSGLMYQKRIIPLLVAVFGLFCSVNFTYAQTEESSASAPAEEKKGINITELVFGHVSDSYEWHLFSIKHENAPETPVALPLPIIIYQSGKGLSFFMASVFEEWHKDADGKVSSNSYNGYHLEKAIKEKVVADDGSPLYDLSVTKNVLSMLFGVLLLLWAMLAVGKKSKLNGSTKAPSGFQNAIEAIVIFLRDEVARPNLGGKYMRYMPLLLSIFFFIWINNLLGLLPGGANFTGNIAVTACLALITFIVMMANSNKHFWGHLLNPPNVPFLVKCLLVLIEVMSLCIKPIALMIRLFANMLAGHIVILSVICMIFIFAMLNKWAGGIFVPISLAFSIFMFMLELLVAAIQAFIFANLAAVFIGQAIEDNHSHDHDMAHNTDKELVM